MDDRIVSSLTKLADSDPYKGGIGERFKIGLTNLTEAEARRVAMLFIDLQSERDK